ncbi:MAG: enoyl-CoA hydratase/isomerase family protein [Candidatus Marinimicrobia bacterium]|nr:enoyl-CoA hydratase/isomerase family protein [Candidatus Neomarinimicrobiota bacterium]
MTQKIEKVAVLGAGVMGAQIAGHLANTGIPSYLFDINQELAVKGIEVLGKLKPAPLYNPKNSQLITPCNYDDHLEKIKEVDWVIEAVAERLDIKRIVFDKISPYFNDHVIITSNTSGLPLADLAAAFSEDVQKRFMITHFFNPPRYMRLLELVKGEKTDDDIYNAIAAFGRDVLGKGIVHAKDTPNFIGNRIGGYGLMITMQTAIDMGLTIEEVDKLTGTISGRMKSATFRTADVVGLDTLVHVSNTSYEHGENDEERDIFKTPAVLQGLLDKGRLGAKTKAGFYQKVDKSILTLDFATGEYSPQKPVRFDAFRLAKDHQKTGDKIAALAYSDDKGGKFFWEILARTLIYSANRIPEISDDIVNVDNALKWGFGWEMGPFETWDAIGLERSITRMQAENKKVPEWILTMVNNGFTHFYEIKDGALYYYDKASETMVAQEPEYHALRLPQIKSSGNLVQRDWSASLIDLGDGVLNVEFHSVLQAVLNPIDGSIIDMLNKGLDLLDAGDFTSMVIGHEGQNFCAGANLAGILNFCEKGDYNSLEQTVKAFQDLSQRIRFSKAPVVAAPFHLTLGGGFEFIGPAAHRVAAAELYIGAVEVGVGLIPGAGGNLRLLLNLMANKGKSGALNVFPIAQQAFETIGFAKIATSANHAQSTGYLLKTDTVVMNRDQLLWTAKQKAMELSDGYTPPLYRDDLKLPGTGGRTAMVMALKGFKAQGKISEHDEKIGKKLAYVLTGGDKAGLTKKVDEQYLLDIEREAFVSLAGEPLTHDRIAYMLKRGKPLRN